MAKPTVIAQTTDQQAFQLIVTHLKGHRSAIQTIQRREAETAQRLAKLDALQAETRLIRMELSNYVTSEQFESMHDRVTALEKVSETPKERAERLESQRVTALWVMGGIVATGLLVFGFLTTLSGRLNTLEQTIRPIPQPIYPGR